MLFSQVRKAAPAPNQPPDRSADAHETSEAEEEPVDASKDNEEEILAGRRKPLSQISSSPRKYTSVTGQINDVFLIMYSTLCIS